MSGRRRRNHHPGRQGGQRRHLQYERNHQGGGSECSQPGVAHYLQHPRRGTARPQPVASVGQAVLVEGAGDQQPRSDPEGGRGKRRQVDRRCQPDGTAYQGADSGPYHRKPEEGRSLQIRRVRPGRHRDAGQVGDGGRQAFHSNPHSAKVATSVTAAAAARTKGMASNAPEPSPNRIFKFNSGVFPSHSSRRR